jgi:hypothetical protein
VLDIINKLSGPDGEAWHNALKAQLKAGVCDVAMQPAQAKSWRKWNQVVYDTCFPELGVVVPELEERPGMVALYIARGLTCDRIFAAMKTLFKKVWKWCDGSIDAQLDSSKEVRSPQNGSYVIYVKDAVEPDPEYLGKSVRQVDPNGSIGVTLLERIFHGMVHFAKTAKHLDVKGYTLCSGSRYRGGNVPNMCLGNNGDASVHGFRVDGLFSRSSVREVILGSLAT